ncbi:uncharacterized protein TRAVEDRAFT_53145 [Trametes versicolor FP-101664 SS1]|uniref:uncharacterized protein n=1 Tax=Trametes versicolor (strain FP-101664) TaxID=717944 RepID=UPI00046218B7|nr:uncharacterized protein TRAVEDRAFT_53145 [Trametes versicolor FP-101664 SS1]EIW52704.1 hypothetical protein TRAVEDRAFT_53145 [Trametes versicolor FP-101664 SS1]
MSYSGMTDLTVAVNLERPFSHKPKNKYYKPQLLRMASLLRDLRKQLDGKAITDDDLRSLTSDNANYHKHATALLKWESDVASRKQEHGDALTASREARILENLKDLGYVEDDFPSADSKEWSKIVYQPKVLTDRIWINIKPKLEALIQEEKESRILADFEERVEERLDQISGYYEDFVAGLPEADRMLLPNLIDVHGLPSIDALARENEAQGDVAQEDFQALTAQVLQEAEAYAAEAKAIAVKALIQSFSVRGASSYLEDLRKITPDEAMTRHYALFRCGVRHHSAGGTMSPIPDYLTFEALHDHWRVQHPMLEWGAQDYSVAPPGPVSWGYIQSAGEFPIGTGMDGKVVLEAAGLPHDTPMEVLTELVRSGRLYCSCGDPTLPPPEQLDWPTFIAHVVEDLAQFRERKAAGNKSAAPNPKLILKSHHPLSGPAACITLLPEGADTAPAHVRASTVDPKTRKKIEERLALRSASEWIPICRVCKALTARRHVRHGYRTGDGLELPETPEGIVHHLRGW